MIDAQRQKIAKVDTSEEKEKPKSAEEMLQEVLASATPSDVYGEYLHFLKVMPKLLNNAEQELVGLKTVILARLCAKEIKGTSIKTTN